MYTMSWYSFQGEGDMEDVDEDPHTSMPFMHRQRGPQVELVSPGHGADTGCRAGDGPGHRADADKHKLFLTTNSR